MCDNDTAKLVGDLWFVHDVHDIGYIPSLKIILCIETPMFTKKRYRCFVFWLDDMTFEVASGWYEPEIGETLLSRA